jgi:hypothetical protein
LGLKSGNIALCIQKIKMLKHTGDQMNALELATKPTYNELEQKIKQLEKEVLEYLRKAKELNKERKVTEYSHLRRTISLMHINEELNREIKELKRSDTEELGAGFS